MKTSIFEPTIFKKNLKRFMPLWLSYFFIWILILSGNIIIIKQGMSDLAFEAQSSFSDFAGPMEAITRGGSGAISFIFMILSAFLVFSFMYSENSAVFTNSLPIKREKMFWSTAFSGIVPIIIANIIIFLLMLILSFSMEIQISSVLLYWLLVSSLVSLGYYGLAVLCCNVSGNTVASVIIYVLFSFVAVVVYIAYNFAARFFMHGFTAKEPSEAFITNFSPPVKLLLEPIFGFGEEYIPGKLYFIIFALAAIVFIFISSLLFRNRKMETAGEFISQKRLRPVFKVCMGLGSALVLGVMLYSIFFGNLKGGSSILLFLLCTLISAAIGYYVGEALLEKRLSCFKDKKSNRLFFAVSLVVIAFVIILGFDAFGYEKKIPAAENVKSVSIYARGAELSGCENPEVIDEATALHKIFVESEAESIENGEWSGFRIELNYELKDGKELTREYIFFYNPEGSYEDLPNSLKAMERFINLKPVVLERLKLDFENMKEPFAYIEGDFRFETNAEKHEQYYSEWTMKRFRDFYENAVWKDAENGNIGHRSILADKKALENFYDCSVQLSYINEKDEDGYEKQVYRRWSVRPELNSEYTLAWLKEHGIEPTICAERKTAKKDYSDYYGSLFWHD